MGRKRIGQTVRSCMYALALVAGISGCGQPGAPTIGKQAPDFQLQRLDGTGQVSLADLLKEHKPVVLNAWASWCPPCQKETPDFVAEAQKLGDKVTFVGVNMTSQEYHVSDAKDFVVKYHVPYSILMDPQHQFSDAYQVSGFPTTYVLLPSGTVSAIKVGGMTRTELDDTLQSALSQLNGS